MNSTLIDINELCSMLSISKSTAFRWQKENILPKSRLIGMQAVRWLRSDVEAFIKEKFNIQEVA